MASKGRLFIPQIYSCDCPKCGEYFETGISMGDAEVGDVVPCPECGEEIEIEEVDDL